MSDDLSLAFACVWATPPQPTWSYTPWKLRSALRSRLGARSVPDIDLTYPRAHELLLKATTARRHEGRWVSMWRHAAVARRYTERRLARLTRRTECDAVLQIGDLGITDRPFLLYQDLSFDVLLSLADEYGKFPRFPTLSRSAVLRLRDRQLEVYEQASAILAMSRWFAQRLTALSGIPPEKVHVVHPGASAHGSSATPPAHAGVRPQSGPRRRLLSVGREFAAKGGAQIVAAVSILRRTVDPDLTLTVAGPPVWPLPGPIPDGVDFRGPVPIEQVRDLYDGHDLFVLPSDMEAFGIVFAEALARGLPCVGRDAFAMPEIIKPGRNGALIRSTDPQELADAIAATLADDDLYAHTAADAATTAAYFSWSRAADEVAAIASKVAQ